MTLKQLFFIPIFFCLISARAQNIESVTARIDGQDIIVSFNIVNAQKDQTFDITLWYSINGGTFYKCNSISCNGSNCNSVSPGTGKTISWTVLSDLSILKCNTLDFEVRAKVKTTVQQVVDNNVYGSNYTETVNGVQIEMIFVKGGTFTMGCTNEQGSDCYDDEKPAHSVSVDDYYIGKFEVSQAQWHAVMGNNPATSSIGDNYPVETVSWDDIQGFLTKLNQKTGKTYSLPTEAQWEYAARGGNKSKGYKYSGSNSINDVTWYSDNSGSKTHIVGQKNANELGIYDMSGNVYEWCSDWKKGYPGSSGVSDYTGSGRVCRGGGWNYLARHCRVSRRRGSPPADRYPYLGFRLVSPK